MLEKMAGILILAGLVLSVAGSLLGHEDLKMTGTLVLLLTATVAGYRLLKFYVLTSTSEFTGICLEQKRFPSHYLLSFRAGGTEVYSGRASLLLGEKIKMGEKARVKMKGPVILELEKIR